MKNKYNDSVWHSFAMVGQFGFTMIVPIVLCTLFGVWLGGKLHVPAITILFFMIGAVAGGRSVYHMARKVLYPPDQEAMAEEEDKKEDDVKKD